MRCQQMKEEEYLQSTFTLNWIASHRSGLLAVPLFTFTVTYCMALQ